MAGFNQVPDVQHGSMPYTPLNGTSLPTAAKSSSKKWTPSSDAKADKKAGIKPGASATTPSTRSAAFRADG